MLRLRPYKPCDAEIIASWNKDELSTFKWSADRFGVFPVTAEMINHKYLDENGDCTEPDNFYPFTACQENEVVGSLILRYTNGNPAVVRFGFVIVDDTKRGKGYGKKMLQLALQYAFEILQAEKVTLGVFENNPSAYYCYRSAGFVEVTNQQEDLRQIRNEIWKCLELQITRNQYLENKG